MGILYFNLPITSFLPHVSLHEQAVIHKLRLHESSYGILTYFYIDNLTSLQP